MEIEKNDFNWESFLSIIKNELGESVFDTWVSPLCFNKVEANILYISSPSQFIKNWVVGNFKDIFTSVLQSFYPSILDVEFVVVSISDDNNVLDNSNTYLTQEVSEEQTGSRTQLVNSSLFNTFEVKLNENYVFDNFVVGGSNEFAYNAARKVAFEDKIYFNPLFIYGGVGLGKTHLMHSIAWHLVKSKSSRKFLYVTAEKFANLFVSALQDKNIMSFKEMFRSTDLLIIDDFQFISGKGGVQEEFFHTFNTLISQGKQIVMSADKSPLSLENIGERITSRLQAGLAVDIHATTYELRMAIVDQKAKSLGVKVPKDVLELLAHTITSNVRELEGGLRRIVSYHQLMGRKIDIDMTMDVLADILKYSNKTIGIELIQKKVAEHYDIKLSDLSSTKRDKHTSKVRHIAIYIAKQITQYSLKEIGRHFGGRDHTTVMYSVDKIEEALKKDMMLDKDIKLLINIIQKS